MNFKKEEFILLVKIWVVLSRDEDPEFFSTDPDPAQLKKIPDPTPDPT